MKYGELPKQPKPGVVLYCRACRATYSAYRGDYFMTPGETIGRCSCPVAPPLILARLQHAPPTPITPEEGEDRR